MILDSVNKSIELILGAAVTTNAMPVTADYVDLTTTTTLAGSSDTQSNGTTAVTIVAAPGASTQRKVNYISVYNADTVSHSVTIQLNNNTTLRTIIKVTLSSGETLQYSDINGWGLTTTTGLYALLAGSVSQDFSCNTLTTGTGILGFTDGSSASAGYIREYISSVVASGSAVSLTTATAANITSISLIAGDWDIFGHVGFTTAATTNVTRLVGSISTTSATLAVERAQTSYIGGAVLNTGANGAPHFVVPDLRLSINSTTTVYLIGLADFTVSTANAFGSIKARRR